MQAYSEDYAIVHRVLLTLAYRFRVFGRHNLPAKGPALLVCNHQSFLDPIVNGAAASPHHLVFVARMGLYKFKPFSKLIESYNAIPIRQGEADPAAIRAALEQLAMGRIVLVYAEGQRTPDGAMHPFQRGAAVLLKRAKCPVIPMAIEGAFDAGPRHKKFPSLWGHRIAAAIGPTIYSPRVRTAHCAGSNPRSTRCAWPCATRCDNRPVAIGPPPALVISRCSGRSQRSREGRSGCNEQA